jgi:hypothetical protein
MIAGKRIEFLAGRPPKPLGILPCHHQLRPGNRSVVDEPSKGALAISAVVLAAFEQLLPLFDGDERRTILFLHHVICTVLKRPVQLMFQTLRKREEPLDKIGKGCRKMEPLYGAGWDMRFERPKLQVFEMKVRRCFFRDFFAGHDATLVTTVVCAFDVNWMQAIDPGVSGLRAERTSLLSLGDGEVPVRGAQGRRSPGPLHRRARAALHRQTGTRLIG